MSFQGDHVAFCDILDETGPNQDGVPDQSLRVAEDNLTFSILEHRKVVFIQELVVDADVAGFRVVVLNGDHPGGLCLKILGVPGGGTFSTAC